MPRLIPNRYLFKFEFPLHRCAKPPKIDGRADRWDKRWLLPPLYAIDGEEPNGDVWATWDDEGLYVACSVTGRSRSLICDPDRYWKSDNLRLMTDMRDTRSIRRATRFCQQFFFMPIGGGKNRKDPVAGGAKVHRASDDAPVTKSGDIPIASVVSGDGYQLTAHLPARVLSGFDPAENPRIGLFYMLEDCELGHQSLTIGDDLNWYIDPSTWPTAVLKE